MYQLNPYLRSFWTTQAKYKVLHGGRASSKSHDAAGMAVFLAANYSIRILCARQFQNRIDESVYTLIKEKIEGSEYNGEFEITKNSIKHKSTKSEFIFYGIARNLAEIKSTEGISILWLEEAQYLTAEQWNVIKPTVMRNAGAQIWIIFNPQNFMDYVYQEFIINTPEDCITKEINWDNNPFLAPSMIEVIDNDYRRDPELARHIYGGVPLTGQDKSVINLNYILAAIDAHKKLGWEQAGKKVSGFDVADDGDDTNARADVHGNVIMAIDEWRGLEDELLKSCSRVYNGAKLFGSSILWDSIGVGAHCGAKFKELNEENKLAISYDPFNAGGPVPDPDGVYMKLPHITIKNKEHFANAKAYWWDNVASRFRKTYEAVEKGVKHPFDELVSINSATIPEKMLNKIKMELSAPRKDVDGMGKFKVEAKKDMIKRGIKSPNVADAIIMSLMLPKRAAVGFFDLPRR